VDDGFHCTPLVPGCLKPLQYVLPCAVGAAQRHPSNEVNSLACAAQYDRRARADAQLWIPASCGTNSISENENRAATADLKTKIAQRLPTYSLRHYRGGGGADLDVLCSAPMR
jgi:hypothetical protein